MIRFIRRSILKMTLFFLGVKFYVTDIQYPYNEISSIKIELPNGVTVNFIFYENKVHYYFHIFNILKKSENKVYTILVNFQGECCKDIKELYKLRLHYGGLLKAIIGNDNYLYEQLAAIYLDIITDKHHNLGRNCGNCSDKMNCKHQGRKKNQ